MRIVYLAYLDLTTESGVLKKIRRQVASWRGLGCSVRVIYVSRLEPRVTLLDFEECICSSSLKSGRYWRVYFFRVWSALRVRRRINGENPSLIYFRHILWFPLLSRVLRGYKVIAEFNTNDVSDAKSRGAVSCIILLVLRRLFLRNVDGVISVTSELKQYIPRRLEFKALTNSINVPSKLPIKSPRPKRFFFMSSPGQPWQGVDKIVLLAHSMPNFEFRLAGWTRSQLSCELTDNVKVLGYLGAAEIQLEMQNAGYAIGPLALHRKSMNSTSAIKVGEYLAHNLPVLLGYKETAIHGSFLCELQNCENNIDPDAISRIIEFTDSWKERTVPRNALMSIDESNVERARLQFLECFR